MCGDTSGVGLGVGEAVGEGEGLGVGVEVGVGVGVTDGVGLGEALGDGVGVGVGGVGAVPPRTIETVLLCNPSAVTTRLHVPVPRNSAGTST